MNIPRTIRIGSVNYSVELSDTPVLFENEKCRGIIDYDQSKIVLDAKSLERQQLELTLLHEVVHGMLHDRGLEQENDEMLVDALAYALHQLIIDNYDLFATLDTKKIISEIQKDLKEKENVDLSSCD